jgi:hypothetical protein
MAELFKIMLAEVRQDIEIDIVRLEGVGILLKFIAAQPVAKIGHAVSSLLATRDAQLGTLGKFKQFPDQPTRTAIVRFGPEAEEHALSNWCPFLI